MYERIKVAGTQILYIRIILISYSSQFLQGKEFCFHFPQTHSLTSKVLEEMYLTSKIEKQGLSSPAGPVLFFQSRLLGDLCI